MPCAQHTPDLVRIHERYQDRDVKFIAITDETASELSKIEQFVEQLGVPWPVGYGASETIKTLGVTDFPVTFVIGRNGQIVWNSLQFGNVDGAIRKAL